MAQDIFKRYEKKYLLTEGQYQQLMLVIRGGITLDQYGRHTISNIYFDTPDYQLIRASLEKPLYKEKLRLRGYGTGLTENSPVYVELKKKFESVVYKRRVEMSMKEARQYLYDGVEPKEKGQIWNEIDYTKHYYDLKPMVYLSYEREAYECRWEPEIRITFDRNMRGRTEDLDLRIRPYGKLLTKEGITLMEIKAPGAIPVWMSHLLGELKIYPVSFSKYGTFYKEYITMQRKEERRKQKRIYSGIWTEGGIVCA